MLKKSTIILSIIFLFITTTANSKTHHRMHHHYAQSRKHYAVLQSSANYTAKGTASWYGAEFNRKRTSTGERFNMYGMTAAHKTLPLPTYVQVTNLINGKKVTVKVNDRGPFIANRLIDLSYAAAKKIGMLGRGTAPVYIRAL